MSDSCCGSLDGAVLEHRQRRVLAMVLGINLVAFALMVTGSVLSGSSALLSGTLDNLGDALTYAVTLATISSTLLVKARVAFFKGLLILGAACGVAVQIVWRVSAGDAPIAETMGLVAFLNLLANLVCLRLLHPFRHTDLNMSSVWECSRNDVFEGCAVLLTAGLVWIFQSAWPDLLVAVALLVMFLRSASRVLSAAWREMRQAAPEIRSEELPSG